MFKVHGQTIGGCLTNTARQHPNNLALEAAGGVLSYARLDAESDELARYLLAMGVQKGERVAIWAELCLGTLVAFYAVVKIGAVAAMVGTSLLAGEVRELIETVHCRWLLYGDGYKQLCFPQMLEDILPLSCLERAVYIGEGEAGGLLAAQGRPAPEPQADEDTLTRAMAAVSPTDTATILFTSGTMARPRGVMSTHGALLRNGAALARGIAARAEDRFCAALPMFHCFCLGGNLLSALCAAACVVLPVSRRTGDILRAVEKGRCTVLHSVPTLLFALCARPDLDAYDLSSLRIGMVGGAPYTPGQFCAVAKKLPFTLLPSYGQTEAASGLTLAHLDDDLTVRSTTVGHFLEGITCKVVDVQTGATLPAGQAGEICFTGYNVMQGYYDDPALTNRTIDRDGFVHTGDLGHLDGAGNLHLAGRLKNFIIRGGENISCLEIEQALLEIPHVREACVVGVPSDHYGEEVCACIIPDETGTPDPQAIKKAAGRRLAYFKVPEYILLFEDFPRTPSGKLAIGEIKKAAMARLTAQRTGTPREN